MLEAHLEDDVIKWAEDREGEAYKLKLDNRRGWMDRTIFLPDRKILLPELKRPKKNKRYHQQKVFVERLQELGFPAAFIQSIDELEALYHEHYGS